MAKGEAGVFPAVFCAKETLEIIKLSSTNKFCIEIKFFSIYAERLNSNCIFINAVQFNKLLTGDD